MKNKIFIHFSSHLGSSANEMFVHHIRQTIGTINVSISYTENYNEKSLYEIYNDFLEREWSGNEIVVFCHPDIYFGTPQWGIKLFKHFNMSDFGIIGVAGTKKIPDSGKWWGEKDKLCGIVQHTDGEKIWTTKFSQNFNGIEPVVAIDGVFIALDPQKISSKFPETEEKFHFYDLMFCVENVINKTKLGVICDLRILHKSVGKTNDEWENGRISFLKRYKDYLPIISQPHYEPIKIKLTETPKLSVIIPTKNNITILKENLKSWENVVKYENYEIIIADTGSDESVFEEYRKIKNEKTKIVKYDYYNFAKINNDVVKNHLSEETELILFCNDDIELLNDAITQCVDVYNKNKKKIGSIGIRLHYQNSLVQHCGIRIEVDKSGNFYVITHNDLGSSVSSKRTINFDSLGNTGAFMMVNRRLFNEIGGFNENYIECFEDVEFNINLLLKRKINVTCCNSVAYHFESYSRNKSINKNKNSNVDYIERLRPFIKNNEKFMKKYIVRSKLDFTDFKTQITP